jgi:hypothetical protein
MIGLGCWRWGGPLILWDFELALCWCCRAGGGGGGGGKAEGAAASRGGAPPAALEGIMGPAVGSTCKKTHEKGQWLLESAPWQ